MQHCSTCSLLKFQFIFMQYYENCTAVSKGSGNCGRQCMCNRKYVPHAVLWYHILWLGGVVSAACLDGSAWTSDGHRWTQHGRLSDETAWSWRATRWSSTFQHCWTITGSTGLSTDTAYVVLMGKWHRRQTCTKMVVKHSVTDTSTCDSVMCFEVPWPYEHAVFL